MEKKDGRFFNSISFLLDGVDIAPVKIYPTIVEGIHSIFEWLFLFIE
jgi:hypothetical protein